MDLKELYGMAGEMTEMPEIEENEMEEKEDGISKSFEFTFDTKSESKSIPANAKIKRITTSIRVCEIENGYLIKKRVSTEYETPVVKSKGDEISNGSWGYHEDEKMYFSKTKPSEANLLYGNVK
jgi:hypothetical protein